MDEWDEDVDPLIGPVADLMAEHHLSSTTTATMPNRPPSVETSEVLDTKSKLVDYLSYVNLRSHVREIFTYLLDKIWYRHLHTTFPKTDQAIVLTCPPATNLVFLLLVSIILILVFPLLLHLFILLLFIIDFALPLYNYYTWFTCLKTIRSFLHTIQTHQQWLMQIQGFQLIRPTSSLFESQLYQLRRRIFEELQKHFLLSRQIARQYSTANDQLICYIDLDEFGPLLQSSPLELTQLTNQFDHISINSISKLSHLQLNECIQLIHLNRPRTSSTFTNFQKRLCESIKSLNQIKQNCSMMIDYTDSSSSPSSKRLVSLYFLLRSSCEQLFQMNENDTLDCEQLKRIVQDLKTVTHALEATPAKSTWKVDQDDHDELTSRDNNASNITSYHRFDDRIEETADEVLVCHTGTYAADEDETMGSAFDIDDYEKRLLREQTHCLMQELQTAIQGKKQEWNEREQRLLGTVENDEVKTEEEEVLDEIAEEYFEKLPPMAEAISMLDELKHTFALNKKKLNVNEDIFGEEDGEEIGDSDDDEEEE